MKHFSIIIYIIDLLHKIFYFHLQIVYSYLSQPNSDEPNSNTKRAEEKKKTCKHASFPYHKIDCLLIQTKQILGGHTTSVSLKIVVLYKYCLSPGFFDYLSSFCFVM